MIDGLNNGEFDGIISWAPDRLARNMLEGGMIIDMIDENKIKDIRFSTYPFSKDANGMMLLGLSFVLSKQYSDKLGQDVQRGNFGMLAEGKMPGPAKPGYKKDENKYLVPDNNFKLIEEAWQMRKQGIGLVKIADWLNGNGYKRTFRDKDRSAGMTKQMLSNIFKDTFYYGILNYGPMAVDLRDIPEADFRPMITEEHFREVQKVISQKGRQYLKQQNRFGLMPLRDIIMCSECGRKCTVYPSKSKSGKRYLYYTCRNPECPRCGKGTRGKVIFDWLYKFLEGGIDVGKKEYENLKRKGKINISKRKKSLEAEIRQLDIKSKKQESSIENLSLGLINIGSNIAKKSVEKKLDKVGLDLDKTKRDIEKKKEELNNLGDFKMNYDDFVNTAKNLSVKLKKGDKRQKDAIVRILFVNLFVDGEKVTKYTLKEPFLTLLGDRKNDSVISGSP